jgi:diguanylate cyclase (GGDEF)-like protein
MSPDAIADQITDRRIGLLKNRPTSPRIASMNTAPASRSTIDTDFKRSLLNSIALFRGVDPDQISDLLNACGRTDIEKGRVLLTPTVENQCVYVILSGELSVHIGSLQSKPISVLPPGSCAGEMSLIDDQDPSAFVVATEDSHLMVISYRLLWEMVERSHAFSKNLLIVLSERVRSDNKFIANSLDVIKRAEHNAVTDPLTGLGNRRWMQEMFEREIKRLQHSGAEACLLMIDIDQFKQFNDSYGHTAGDRVVSSVAGALREQLRPTDLVARFGGDEYAALLPGIKLDQGFDTAERLRLKVMSLTPQGLPIPISVSIGISAIKQSDDFDSALQRADAAMYAAKENGRNCVASK